MSFQPEDDDIFEPQPIGAKHLESRSELSSDKASFPYGVAFGNPFKSTDLEDKSDPQLYADAEAYEDDPLTSAPYVGHGHNKQAYRDKWFAVAFSSHALILIVLALGCGTTYMRNAAFSFHGLKQGMTYFLIFLETTTVAALASSVWIIVMQRYGAILINAVMIGAVIVLNLAALACLTTSGWGGLTSCLVCMLLSVAYAFYYQHARRRIPFAAANLSIACSTVQKFPSLIQAAFLGLGAQFLWVVIWTAATLGIRGLILTDKVDASFSYDLALLVLFVSLYWGLQVCQNVIHCTAAGTVGEWWFSVAPRDPVKKSVIRALSTSFGSVCYGSLIVAALKGSIAFLSLLTTRRSRNQNRFQDAVRRLLAYLQAQAEYFNKYAYCQVALYGKDFRSAGHDVTDLFRARGWTSIVHNDLVSAVLMAGCFIVGAISGTAGSLQTYRAFRCTPEEQRLHPGECEIGMTVFISFLVCGAIGFGLCALVSSLIDSSVCTIWVCFAQDPATLQLTHPDEFSQILDAWQRFHPDEIASSGPAYAVHHV